MDRRFFAIVAILVLGFTAYIFMNKKGAEPAAEPTNHTIGSNKYSVRLVEYGDFECPACGQYHPILKQVKDEYKDLIEFQFRHFPLDAIHPAARAAHRAAEAAGNQGKFFEMHDLLYENQASWRGVANASAVFLNFARQLGLDTNRFEADVKSGLTNRVINADITEGKAAGANATPTFVFNGKKLEENPRDITSFRELINTALKEKDPNVVLPSAGNQDNTSPIVNTQTEDPSAGE